VKIILRNLNVKWPFKVIQGHAFSDQCFWCLRGTPYPYVMKLALSLVSKDTASENPEIADVDTLIVV